MDPDGADQPDEDDEHMVHILAVCKMDTHEKWQEGLASLTLSGGPGTLLTECVCLSAELLTNRSNTVTTKYVVVEGAIHMTQPATGPEGSGMVGTERGAVGEQRAAAGMRSRTGFSLKSNNKPLQLTVPYRNALATWLLTQFLVAAQGPGLGDLHARVWRARHHRERCGGAACCRRRCASIFSPCSDPPIQRNSLNQLRSYQLRGISRRQDRSA